MSSGPPRDVFKDTLRAFSPAIYEDPDLEYTGRILLPEVALNAGAMTVDNQGALFSLRNPRLGNEVYAGVKSFTTRPGHVCMPHWMIQFLQIQDSDTVEVTWLSDANKPPRATRAVFQPPDESFFTLRDPKSVLEANLDAHPCLTQGTLLRLRADGRDYTIKVLRTEPRRAVTIRKTDVECDFATPISQFRHSWNEPDTDSSDDELPQPLIVRTVSGRIKREMPAPLHSTYAQREKERGERKFVPGVTVFEDGKEILPPKPREKAEKKRDCFRGPYSRTMD
jgi:hypothetical protein